MSNFKNLLGVAITLIGCLFFSTQSATFASDHADPIKVRFLGDPESNLTGLFVFQNQENLVVILCTRPALERQVPKPAPYCFQIHIDTDSRVEHYDGSSIPYAQPAVEDEGRTYRYGGWIKYPEQIEEDLIITWDFSSAAGKTCLFNAENEIALKPQLSKHLAKDWSELPGKSWVGLRDDPFILQGFSSTNVLAMVVEIPLEKLGNPRNVLVWGTSSRYGRPVDHVGRSLRTMLPRFDFLNNLHPREHHAAIMQRHSNPDLVSDYLRFGASPIFGIRHYDFEPDVVIFSPERWQIQKEEFQQRQKDYQAAVDSGVPESILDPPLLSAFPNGRRLEDDVALLMSQRGDSLLFEVSTADAHAHEPYPIPRPTTNGKPFLKSFPYLAAPNENPMASPAPHLTLRTIVLSILIALGVIVFLLLPWVLWWKCRKQLRNLSAALAT